MDCLNTLLQISEGREKLARPVTWVVFDFYPFKFSPDLKGAPLLLKTTKSEGTQTLFPYFKDLGSFEKKTVAGLHF